MNIFLLVVYIILLLLALGFGGVIAYHVFKYRSQLRAGEAHQATTLLFAYFLVGGGILLLSVVFATIAGLII